MINKSLIIIMYLRLTSTAASIASASVPSAALVLMLIVLTAIEVIIIYDAVSDVVESRVH